jgi:hypothetical protein
VTRTALAIALVPGLAAPAQATPVIGIGEQHPEMFSDDRRQRTRPTLRTLRAQIRRYGR